MSDQDFFFDEDEKPAVKSGAKKGSTSGKDATPAPSSPAPVDSQRVTLTVVVLVGVIGLLLGVLIGLFIGKGMATPATAASTTPAGAAVGAGVLTQEQINAGQLPAGHPQVPAVASTATTPVK